jgi:hypothetical protein
LSCGGSRELRIETPKARKEKSSRAIDLKGIYVSTNHGDLGSRMKGGEKAIKEER